MQPARALPFLAFAAAPAASSSNTPSLRFLETGAGRQDRVRIRIDDDDPSGS